MSKKIAQLTKVIGMLVNKTEEHGHDIEHIHRAYESRMVELVDQSNAQVAEARRGMGTDGHAGHIVRTLIRQHETEKRTALQEFQEFKRRSKEHEQMLVATMEKRTEALMRDLQEVKQDFDDRIQQFTYITHSVHLEKGTQVEEMRGRFEKEKAEMMVQHQKRMGEALADRAAQEESKLRRLQEDFEKALQQQELAYQERLGNRRGEEEMRLQAAVDATRKEMSLDVERYRMSEASLRHTLTELQSDYEDLQAQFSRREKELQEHSLHVQQQLELDLRNSTMRMEEVVDELERVKERHTREIEQVNLRLLEQQSIRESEMLAQQRKELSEVQRAAHEKLSSQEKLLKNQMNELFLKLQAEHSERQKGHAQSLQDARDEKSRELVSLKKAFEEERSKLLVEHERTEQGLHAKLVAAMDQLRTAEDQNEQLRIENHRFSREAENLRIQLADVKRNLYREHEMKLRELENNERKREQEIVELKRNLDVLKGNEDRVQEAEKELQYIKTQMSDLQRSHERQVLASKEAHVKEVSMLKTGLEKLRESHQQQMDEWGKQHRKELEEAESRQMEVSNALMVKYEDMLAYREKEADRRHMQETKQIHEQYERQLLTERERWAADREVALREATSSHHRVVEVLQREMAAMQQMLAQKQAELSEVVKDKSDEKDSGDKLRACFLKEAKEMAERQKIEFDKIVQQKDFDHREHIRTIEEALDAVTQQHERDVAQLRARASELEFQLATRAARPIDEQRIRQLEADLREKDLLCRKIMEDLQHFKGELHDRENLLVQRNYRNLPPVESAFASGLKASASLGNADAEHAISHARLTSAIPPVIDMNLFRGMGQPPRPRSSSAKRRPLSASSKPTRARSPRSLYAI
jgi:hypothetical protein